ncbi:MAG: carboxypeptidase regulatory-like domain-containing protein, partial [Acidobacteriota bacterium]
SLRGTNDETKLKELLDELLKDRTWEELEVETGIFKEDLSEQILKDLGQLEEPHEDDFDAEKARAEPKYKIERGEVWSLGNHRLMCGDATSKEDVDKLMNGQKADMVFTDPPYGINIVGNGKTGISGEVGFKGGRKIGVGHMKKALLFTLASMLIMAIPAMAQTGALIGTVVTAANVPVEGARVSLHADDCVDLYAYTNADGQYTFDEVPAGVYMIRASLTGVGTGTVNDVTVIEGQMTEAPTIVLTKGPRGPNGPR